MEVQKNIEMGEKVENLMDKVLFLETDKRILKDLIFQECEKLRVGKLQRLYSRYGKSYSRKGYREIDHSRCILGASERFRDIVYEKVLWKCAYNQLTKGRRHNNAKKIIRETIKEQWIYEFGQ